MVRTLATKRFVSILGDFEIHHDDQSSSLHGHTLDLAIPASLFLGNPTEQSNFLPFPLAYSCSPDHISDSTAPPRFLGQLSPDLWVTASSLHLQTRLLPCAFSRSPHPAAPRGKQMPPGKNTHNICHQIVVPVFSPCLQVRWTVTSSVPSS